MTDRERTSSQPGSAIPADDPQRRLSIAKPDDPQLRRVGMAGDTYTILLTGEDTEGRYCLIDMHVPPGGGPPPHRHDFEEMFSVLEGEIRVTFRGESTTARAGETVNVPANAPHSFTNVSKEPARLLCMCTPPGQEEFFMAVGTAAKTRTEPTPKLSAAEQGEAMEAAKALAPKYRTELLEP